MALKNGSTSSAGDFTGMIWSTILRAWDTTVWLLCNGQAVSRSTYSVLFAALCPSSIVTITIASPAVITWTGNTLQNGDIVVFTNSGGALPTGITSGTQYYVVGLSGNTFNIAKTYGGAAINTSGSQSGTQTAQVFTFGVGDGSTTFNVPNISGRSIIGTGTGTTVATISSVAGNIITASGIGGNGNEFQTGQSVVFTAGTAGNLTNGATYFVVRQSNTTFELATSLANAQNNSVITLAGTETGSFALTYSTRVLGDSGGEESHAQSNSEILAHVHTLTTSNAGAGVAITGTSQEGTLGAAPTSSVGGNNSMNVMNPNIALNYLIHV